MSRTHKNDFLPLERRLDQQKTIFGRSSNVSNFKNGFCIAESQLEQAFCIYLFSKSARTSKLHLFIFGSGLDSPKIVFWPSSTAPRSPKNDFLAIEMDLFGASWQPKKSSFSKKLFFDDRDGARTQKNEKRRSRRSSFTKKWFFAYRDKLDRQKIVFVCSRHHLPQPGPVGPNRAKAGPWTASAQSRRSLGAALVQPRHSLGATSAQP